MRSGLRTVASALLIIAGALLVVMWAVAGVAVRAVDDGTAVHGMAQQALSDPEISEAIADDAAEASVQALRDRGVDLDRLGLESALRGLVEQAVQTEAFRSLLLDQVDTTRDQVADQLTAALDTPQPLVLTIDVSDWVNAQIESIPVIGAAVPDIRVPGVEVEVLDRETFAEVRGAYAVVSWLATWGVWCGAALIVIGMFVTHRFRWFLAKAGLAIAVIAGAAWVAVRLWGLDALALVWPFPDGSVATLVAEVVTDAATPAIEARLTTVAVWAAIAALVLFLVGVLTMPRAKPAPGR